MAEKKPAETVTLLAPNGQRVTVAESKQAARVAAGYRLPGKAKSDSPPGKSSAGT